MKRFALALVALLVLIGSTPFLPAGLFRGRVTAALERSLLRKVEIGDIRFTFFPAGPVPGPGFVLENVTIHEDPRAGIEPFAHTEELGASVRWLSLLQGRLELSGISLGDATINLVKSPAGLWNLQYLFEPGANRDAPLPALRMRTGRVNFKFIDTKSVFYFGDADLDITPGGGGSIDFNFGGAPSRTDKSTQEFGRFFAVGSWDTARNLDLDVELESSSLEEALRLADPHGFGIHGKLALKARLTGPGAALRVTGTADIGDIHRWDLLPEGDRLALPFEGSLDAVGEKLQLVSTSPNPDPPMAVGVRAVDFFKTPIVEANISLTKIPLATLFQAGHHMGAELPESLKVEGTMSGNLAYNRSDGLQGEFLLGEASFTLPEREPVHTPEAKLTITNGTAVLAPVEAHIGEQVVHIDGSVSLATPHTVDGNIQSPGIAIEVLRSFGLASVPVVGELTVGTWKGRARYRHTPDPEWSGDSELRDALVAISGIAEPVQIESAVLNLRGKRISLDRIRAKVGPVAFRGSYAYEPDSTLPHHFAVALDSVDAVDLDKLLAPALGRNQPGFLARTLRLGSAEIPDWLKNRKAEGSVRIDSLAAGKWTLRDIRTSFLWEGTRVAMQGSGKDFSGELETDLSGGAPRYTCKCFVTDGPLQLSGTWTAAGPWTSFTGDVAVKTSGTLPEGDFRVGPASLTKQPGAEPRWKLSITSE